MRSTIIATGMMVLVGCIYIPGDYKDANGRRRPEELIGPETSTKPLRMGDASTPEGKKLLMEESPLNSADKIKTPLRA